MEPIRTYDDFVRVILAAGFSMGGGNDEGIFSAVGWNWDEEAPYETPVRWHTGDPETDPWEWRMRVLDERQDIAYAKVFLKKSGYITRDWAPHFIALRRGAATFEEAYDDGLFSVHAKRIYETVARQGALPVHVIKPMAGFGKTDKAAFERALTELQMRMYLTMCGRQQKATLQGESYGWSSTVFCTVEQFWGQDVMRKAAAMDALTAAEAIRQQILWLNPTAPQKKIDRFLKA